MKAKRFLALILSILLITCGMPAVLADEAEAPVETATVESETYNAAATSGNCGENVTWKFENGTLTISGTGEMQNYDAFDDPAPWSTLDVQTVKIENGVTGIGDYAFSGCEALKSVTIPGSVRGIGIEAFDSCASLEALTIPNGVTSIGTNAFNWCQALQTLQIPNSVTSIGRYAFTFCSALRTITIPDGVTSIEPGTFSNCSALQSVQLPDHLTSIGWDAFNNCSKLTSITIPTGVTQIENYTFLGCASLRSVTIPAGVTSIGENVFSGCTALTSVTIPDSVTSIARRAFWNCPSLTAVTIPAGVKEIGEVAFGYVYNTSIHKEEKLPGFTISGYTGSEAEKYAKENGFAFKALAAATKLSTPKLSSVKNTSSGVQISWKAVSGAEKYKLYYKTTGGWKSLGTTTETSYTWTKAKAGTKYSFTVRAVDKNGKTSGYDKTGKTVTYVKQSNVSKVENTTSGIKITWQKSSGAAKYTLYYKTTGGWKKIGTTEKTSYTWKKAKSGTKYTFTIKAVGKDGSAASYNNGKSITYLSAPTKIAAAKSGSTGIKVSWGKVTGAAKYRIYYKTTGGWKKLKDVTSTSYTWTKGKKGTKYTFTVRAIAKDGKTMSAYDTKGKSVKR